MIPRLRLLALLAPIVALAALLRFTALDWGLRHVPHQDERSFVESVARMIVERDLDHRFYEYPGLFLYMLVPVQAAAGGSGPPAYHAARGLVAFCGVMSVVLVALLGVRLGGPWLGLAAAAFLAVSPLEVVTAHMVRPDVVLEMFALLVFLALFGVGRAKAGDLRAGAALAAAISIKFTGLLLVPGYLLVRLREPGPRLFGLLRAACVALALGALFTPYALIRFDDFARGARYQLSAHYKGQAPQADYLDHLALLLRGFADGLGWPAAALALIGLGLALRPARRRAFLPLVVYPLALVLVMASADLLFVRQMLPALCVAALLAALPVQALAERRPWLAALLALGAAAAPLRSSWNYVGNISGALPRDLLLDWAQAHLPAGALVLDARPELGIGFDRARHEVIRAEPRRGPLDGLLAENVDAIVTGPGLGRRWGTLRPLFTREDGPVSLQLQAVTPERRARYAAIPPERMRLSASHAAERLALATDGRSESVWSPGAPQAPGQWLRVDFDAPTPLARVELVVGPRRERHGADLRLWSSADGVAWRRCRDASARGPIEEQSAALRPPSQVLILVPEPLRALRLEIGSPWREPWELAELRLDTRRPN